MACATQSTEFATAFEVRRTLLVGGDGIALDHFLGRPVRDWVQ